MRVGIMQPYFCPYIGYWQLINAVDTYVVYDDVNYIKRGWINRNRLLVNGQVQYITMELEKASQNKLIKETMISQDRRWIDKAIKTIEMSYHKAPFFNECFATVEKAICNDRVVLSEYLTESIAAFCDFLGIQTNIVISSDIEKNTNLRGQEKIIEICQISGGDCYLNAIGGVDLYNREDFNKAGIELMFLKPNNITYKQFSDGFEPNLSIIDVLMFNGRDKTIQLLEQYSLV